MRQGDRAEMRSALCAHVVSEMDGLTGVPESWTCAIAEAKATPGSAATRDDDVARLRGALGRFRAAHAEPMLSAHQMINPLLDLWGLAAAVGDRAPAPIEAMLTALVGRCLTTPAELGACLDEVEAIVAAGPRAGEGG
jgi:hypothetical protein